MTKKFLGLPKNEVDDLIIELEQMAKRLDEIVYRLDDCYSTQFGVVGKAARARNYIQSLCRILGSLNDRNAPHP